MKKVYIVAIVAALMSVLGAIGGLFIPGVTFATAVNIAETFMIAPLTIGATVLFVMGLGVFKAKFRAAYSLICLGIVFLTVGMLQYVVLGSTAAYGSAWVTSGAVELPFLLCSFAFFAGLVMFARLTGVAHVNTYAVAFPAAGLLAAVLAAMIPHVRNDVSAYAQAVSAAAYAMEAVLISGNIFLMARARSNTGALYVPSFAWLLMGSITIGFSVIPSLPIFILLPPGHWYNTYQVGSVFLVAGAVSYVQAAIELNRVKYRELPARMGAISFFGKPVGESESNKSDNAISAITYLAQLSSNSRQIDPFLNKLRVLTSQLQPGESLTNEQQQTLAGIYIQLETYLVNQEQAGRYTHDGLRERIVHRYKSPQEDTFWKVVAAS